MRALKLEGKSIREIDIENNLEAMQYAVYGYIEAITLIPEKVAMIVNEEGRLRGLAFNKNASKLAGTAIVGPALIIGVDGEEFCDLPEEIAREIMEVINEGRRKLP